ncbi:MULTISPECIES: hypothetical protein [Halorussus]|uniref:hypothetical protein n=1 Tax=Halorussus TaxID=1070314 RepID=UPI00140473C1|nr:MULTISPECIES: hypothetical protein [Halorussus]NHN61050.1 hypothetical protein [Halorussus sp. JP-T4]
MAERRDQETAIRELEAALETEDGDEKNFHIRQALQYLELDGEDDPGVTADR